MPLKFNVDTQVIYNIGDPMDHSCATYMHNAVYALANVNAVNLTTIIPKGGLEKFIEAARTLGAAGFDLTTPHKADIVPFLDACEPAAAAFRCVNCVKFEGEKLIGMGVDGIGLSLAVQARFGPVKGKAVLILGAGAVAGLAANELCKSGAARIFIANRTEEKARFIAQTLQQMHGFTCVCGPMEESFLREAAAAADLVIQCTSTGRPGEERYPALDVVQYLRPSCKVVDVLYPDTQLLEACRERGLETMNGQRMMVYQQIPKMKFRFGIDFPEELLPEVEEAVAVGVTMVQFRNSHRKK